MIDHFYTSVAVAVSFAFKTCIARLLLYKYDDFDEASCIRHCVLYLLKTPIEKRFGTLFEAYLLSQNNLIVSSY